MDVITEKVLSFNPSLGETIGDATPYTSANVADVEEVWTYIRYDGSYVLATTVDTEIAGAIVVYPNSTLTDGVIPDPSHLWASSVDSFTDVKVGDEITLIQPAPSAFTVVRTVLAIISPQLLLMSATYGLPADFVTLVDTIAYVSTPIQSIEFFHNYIENSTPINFQDLTTGVTRRARVDGLAYTDTSDTLMTQLGDKSTHYGSLSVAGNNLGDGPPSPAVSQAFIIKHTSLLGPLFVADQINNDIDHVEPPWFIDANSLKYVFRVEASKDLNNPNDVKTVLEDSILGKTGWDDDNLDTGLTDYSISDVVYKRASGEVIDSLELSTNEMTVEFDVNNTVEPTFTSAQTKMVFNHWFMPLPEDEYRLPEFPSGVNEARNRLFKTNFLFDRSPTTVNSGAVAGDNFGGVDQIIKEVECTKILNSKVHVVATILMSSEAVDRISALSDQNYKLTLSTAAYNKTRAKSDKVTLRVDVSTYYTETTDKTMITATNTFYDLPMVEGDTGKESLQIQPQDSYVCKTAFTLHKKDILPDILRTDAIVGITTVSMQLIAKNGTQEFVLDEFSPRSIETEIITDPVYGTIPRIKFSEDRGFASPVDDFRRYIIVERRPDLDTIDGDFEYIMTFTAIQRWEGWESLPAANNAFIDDSAASNHHEGKNHNWAHYFDGTVAGWNMYYRATIKATKDGVPQTYTFDSLLLTQDYNDGIEWDTDEIETYRTDGSGDLIDNQGFMESENTLIQCDMTYLDPPHTKPTLPDLVMVIYMNDFEQGNYKSMYAISSKYDIESDNALIGLTGGLTAAKSNPSGNIFRVEAENNYITNGTSEQPRPAFRIYDLRPESGIPDGMATEDGILMDTENGIQMDVE